MAATVAEDPAVAAARVRADRLAWLDRLDLALPALVPTRLELWACPYSGWIPWPWDLPWETAVRFARHAVEQGAAARFGFHTSQGSIRRVEAPHTPPDA